MVDRTIKNFLCHFFKPNKMRFRGVYILRSGVRTIYVFSLQKNYIDIKCNARNVRLIIYGCLNQRWNVAADKSIWLKVAKKARRTCRGFGNGVTDCTLPIIALHRSSPVAWPPRMYAALTSIHHLDECSRNSNRLRLVAHNETVHRIIICALPSFPLLKREKCSQLNGLTMGNFQLRLKS